VRGPILIQGSFVAGVAVAIQSGLDFIGLGDPSMPTWGGMLSDGFINIYLAPLLMLWPGLAIALTCICLVLLASAMRDVLARTQSPKASRRSATEAPRLVINKEPVFVHEPDASVEASPELLRISDLAVGYHQPDGSTKLVVHDVSLTVHRGEVHGLVGESGSGKTQTAWSLLGLLPAGGEVVAGEMRFEGVDLVGVPEAAMNARRGSDIAYIPQEPLSNLDPSFKVGSQLVEPMVAKLGIGKKEARLRALDLLARVGIPHPERTFASYPHELSGGMAQRVLIAGAVSCEPKLLVADEPTTALDVTVQAEVLDLLRGLQQEGDMGLILVTHNFGVVADICDTVSVMRSGRVIERGPVGPLFKSPGHEYTRALFDAVLDGPDSDALSRRPRVAGV
jgi:peptide/nickel transport system permease protein